MPLFQSERPFPPQRSVQARRAARHLPLAALLLAIGFMAAGGSGAAAQQAAGVEREVTAWLEKATGDRIDGEQLKIGLVDLNGDGRPEVLALYMHVTYCDGTGCRGWILHRGDAGGLTPMGQFSGFTLPKVSLQHSSRGWPDLIVFDARSGRNIQLRFDGGAYR